MQLLQAVTNTVSKKFFEKYYKLEIERIPFLESYNLIDVYLKERYNFYIRKWYKPRMEGRYFERKEAIENSLK